MQKNTKIWLGVGIGCFSLITILGIVILIIAVFFRKEFIELIDF